MAIVAEHSDKREAMRVRMDDSLRSTTFERSHELDDFHNSKTPKQDIKSQQQEASRKSCTQTNPLPPFPVCYISLSYQHLKNIQNNLRSVKPEDVKSTPSLALGNPGDVKPVGAGVSEMRINHGPGYRVYFAQRGSALVLLLCGGDKRTQDRDIRQAQSINRQEQGR